MNFEIEEVKNKIYSIRGKQVMLDKDLAILYEVETKNLNKAVKRNIDRFPQDFMFQLTKDELKYLRFQNGTIEKIVGKGEHSKYLPFVFTQEGVAMLSGILKSKKAVLVNIEIMRAFISMRNYISQNNSIINKLNNIESKQIKFEIETNQKFTEIFDKFKTNTSVKKQGIFFDGQIFDSYVFITDLIKQAKFKIILIDNYVDETTLNLFSKTKVKTTIYTKITNQLKTDLNKYNKQYNNITLNHFTKSHDRFLIIDNQIYHIGASLKDAGSKWFAFSKLEETSILDKLS